MATLHFREYPYQRNLFAINVREIEGEKFKNWQANANYNARVTIILQLDSSGVSANEYQVAPSINIIAKTYAILNIYQTWHVESVSFESYQKQWGEFEISLERQINEIIYKLNAARRQAGRIYTGDWYINYSLNEKHIEVHRP